MHFSLWCTSVSPLRLHWRPGYLVLSVWGSTSGLPTEEERRALLSIVVAIPGYLLSRHRSFCGQWLFLFIPLALHYSLQQLWLPSLALYLHCRKAIPSQHHSRVFEIVFISVVIGICGAGALIPCSAAALLAWP